MSDWQSVLAPAGPDASIIAHITWVLSIGALIILTGVLVLLALAVLRGPRPVNAMRWIVGLGIVVPTLIESGLVVWSMWRVSELTPQSSDNALVVTVTAKKWWWEVRYRDPAGGPAIITANEIRIPAGRPVYLSLTSSDVIHSMWIPKLAGKIDMIPGLLTRLRLQADKPGVYRGQCAEFCGEQHARMALHVVAHKPADFDAWLAGQRRPAAAPSNAVLEQGRAAFVSQRCGACHTIRGVQEGESLSTELGPDLTHVGSRLYLAAGTLRNHRGTLAGWIADPQASKPGANMPAAGDIDGPTLQALAAYLAHLK